MILHIVNTLVYKYTTDKAFSICKESTDYSVSAFFYLTYANGFSVGYGSDFG